MEDHVVGEDRAQAAGEPSGAGEGAELGAGVVTGVQPCPMGGERTVGDESRGGPGVEGDQAADGGCGLPRGGPRRGGDGACGGDLGPDVALFVPVKAGGAEHAD